MLIEVKVPGFPESVTDGTIVAWHKRPGDPVKRDENLVDIETDKVMFEVPAPRDGYLQDIYEREGTTVVAGQVLASIGNGQGKGEAATGATVKARAGAEPAARPASIGAATVAEPPASPSAQRLITEHGLHPGDVEGTGKDGRLLKEDVLRHLQAVVAPAAEGAPAAEAPAVRVRAGPAQPEPFVEFSGEERPQRRVPMTRLRARIAERLVEAQQTAAILSTFNEVNMQPVMEMRHRYRDRFEKEHGVRLGMMSFFIKAAIEALKRFPAVNASLDGTEIVYHGFFDIGVAVASPRGLVVPVIRDADRMGMAEIERKIMEFSDKAKQGTLSIEEISGGTFTLTNGGVFGSLLSTPILNPPQSGILGMHKIQERPVVEDGEVVARPMMYVALSYDHRIIDGREAVQFLVTIKDLLEDPARMLLEI